MRVFSVACLSFALCLPALAGETPWQELAPGVSMRLISGGAVSPSGRAQLALELDMPDNTKTYWRVPGETGLPTELDFTGSSGIGAHVVHWPYPQRSITGGYLDYVYYGRTVLPLEVEVEDHAGRVELSVMLGICSDICVPAQAHFSLPLVDGKPDSANNLRIRQALAEVPIVWDQANEPVGRVTLASDGDAVAVDGVGSEIAADSLIAATAEGFPLFGAPQKSPQSDLVLLPILGKTDNSALIGKDVELTFMTDLGAYTVSRTIEADGDASRPGRDN